ncbi:MAG: hypothetical protein JW839_14235 [Candidatus Lokiarchaeota archaeon]|nr:hypothetical protein [Candidatus Lokiarchaeota archaeon]
MASWSLPEGFYFLFWLYVVVIAIKVSILAVIAFFIKREQEKEEKVTLALMYAFLVDIVCLIVSRICYVAGDFFLTGYDIGLYSYNPAMVVWKLGATVLSAGIVALIFAVDRVVLNNKFKSVFAYAAIVLSILAAAYPVSPGSAGDFTVVATLVMFAQIPIFFLVAVFSWFIAICPGLKRLTVSAFIGILFTILGTMLTAFGFTTPILNNFGQVVLNVYLTFVVSMKIVGYVLVVYSVVNFSRINKALLDYYTSKRICIVHRGRIKGRAFMCANCHVLYCMPCKAAIVEIENKCWNCKQELEHAAVAIDGAPLEAEKPAGTSGGTPVSAVPGGGPGIVEGTGGDPEKEYKGIGKRRDIGP